MQAIQGQTEYHYSCGFMDKNEIYVDVVILVLYIGAGLSCLYVNNMLIYMSSNTRQAWYVVEMYAPRRYGNRIISKRLLSKA